MAPVWLTSIVCLLLLVVVTNGSVCDVRTSCTTCAIDTVCGWCVGGGVARCVEGNAAGPTIVGVTCSSSWQFSTSQIISTVPGFPVHPKSVDVFLKPNQELQLLVQVTPLEAADQKLDLVVVQDASGSMNDDIVTFRRLVPSLVNDMLAYNDDAFFGYTSFVDKPLAPFGLQDVWPNSGRTPKNYVYRLEQNLTQDYNVLLQAVGNLNTQGNRDWCESSLDGLAYSIMDPKVGWREGSKKVIVLATDACFHEAGDSARRLPYSNASWCSPSDGMCCYELPPYRYPNGVCPYTLPANNMDMVMDIGQYFTNNDWKLPGTGEDYVSQAQAKNLILKNNIVPIFAVTNSHPATLWEMNQWNAFKDFIGYGAVYPLTSDSSNLVDAIVSSLDMLSRTVTLAVATDQFGYVKSFTPASYSNVNAANVVNFNVTLFANSTVKNNTIQLTVFGWGTVFINVLPDLPCKGCDGIVNSNSYYDVCGVCKGNDACVDCSGTPFGSKVRDVCGVCDGNGMSCRGCDGVPYSNVTLDACLECGGKNSCIGCDGQAREIPWVKDLCGVCGGNDSCLDCKFIPFGTAKIDACGICAGRNECIGCDGKYSIPPKVVDSCGFCGGNDSCIDCNNVINGTATLDLCRVCNGNNTCRSCNGEYNPKQKIIDDQCGVCGGDGKSCVGCDGVPFSNTTKDRCGICGGKDGCVGCDGVPGSGKVVQCGVCGGDATCVGCDYVLNSNKTWDLCGICGGNNTCIGCDGVRYSGKVKDICGVCDGNGKSCLGCDGIPFSTKQTDRCNVCGGDDSCVGCDEVPFSGAVLDRCKICNGKSECLGCDGVPYSGFQMDNCSVCPNAKNYVENACYGCDGVPYSGVKVDSCGVCGGNNSCVGCDMGIWSNVTVDECGVCPNADNYTKNACFGCDGKPRSGLIIDRCGVCGGNDSCVGCDGIVNSTLRLDRCGICDGNNTCLGCDNATRSGAVLDICGLCGGNGASCLTGCDLKPFSTLTYDKCNKCGGDGTTCKDVPFYLNKQTIAITAGTVGGVMIGIAALIAGILIYKRLTAGAYWYIPKNLLDSTNAMVMENPLFDPKGTGFVENEIFDEGNRD